MGRFPRTGAAGLKVKRLVEYSVGIPTEYHVANSTTVHDSSKATVCRATHAPR